MHGLNLDEFLRYLGAGAMPVIFATLGYRDVLDLLSENQFGAPLWTIAAFFILLTGTTSYIIYRSLVFPVLYRIATALVGRGSAPVDLDIQRWANLQKEKNITKMLGDWGAQIHFLYVASILGFTTLAMGWFYPLERTVATLPLAVAIVVMVAAALVSHWRLQRREVKAFEHDRKIEH